MVVETQQPFPFIVLNVRFKPAETAPAGQITAEFSAAVKTPVPQASFWFDSTDELSVPSHIYIVLCLKRVEELLTPCHTDLWPKSCQLKFQ